MARTDDYQGAIDLAAAELAKRPLKELVAASGFAADGDGLATPFLDRDYRLSYPDFHFSDTGAAQKEIPLQEQVLILHYLRGVTDSRITGKWIAYREIPGAGFYFSVFAKRAIEPLKKGFGENLDGFRNAAAALNGRPIEAGDAGYEFSLFPKTPLQLILYGGDEEFTAEANILFDAGIEEQLSPEDAAWLASLLVYRLLTRA
ncbi:MAG: DUF3786 domain-containing protein [Desulfosarcinaceae bacterium]